MGSQFKYVKPKLSTTCTAMKAGTSLMMRHFRINTFFVFREHNSLLKVNPTSGHDTLQSTYIYT